VGSIARGRVPLLAAVAAAVAVLAAGGCSVLRARGLAEESREVLASDHRAATSLRLLVFGDAGTGKRRQFEVGARMAAECAARGGCALALMAGDNIYETGVRPSAPGQRPDPQFHEKFEKPYEPLGRLDMWAVPGNHDWHREGSIDAEIAYTRQSSRWRMPAPDYEVPRLPPWIHVYGLDTVQLDGAQLARAREALCGAEGWKLLFGHHPIYSSGKHANRRGVLPVLERLVVPLIEACGVHLYLAGHDHHQEHLRAPAFDQVVQGAAAKLHPLRSIAGRPAGVRTLGAAALPGFAILDASAERLELRFFGGGEGEPWREIHCQAYERQDFPDPERRSTRCGAPVSSGTRP
jgi:hypothetical protein